MGRFFDGNGCRFYTKNAGSHQGFQNGTLLAVFLDGTKFECNNEEEQEKMLEWMLEV